jgi:hypothetical protein
MTDDTVSNMLAQSPLAKFSPFTALCSNFLVQLGAEVRADTTMLMQESGKRDAEAVLSVYSKCWYWTLGAYEAVRTMVPGKSSDFFAPAIDAELRKKRRLGALRMVFAKQELMGKGGPAGRDWAVAALSEKGFHFEVDGQDIAPVDLIEDLATLLGRITAKDILKALP